MNLVDVLLYLHIITGFLGLVLGTVVSLQKKSDKLHKKLGFYFFINMTICSTLAIPLSYFRPNLFLFLISIFTLYALITGKRYIAKTKSPEIQPLDWVITFIMGIVGFVMIFMGIYYVFQNENFGIVFFVFGIFSILGVVEDYKNFTGKSKIKNYALTTHISRISGAYIASLTAFLVVNTSFIPYNLAWFLPTIVMIPVIRNWIKQHIILK